MALQEVELGGHMADYSTKVMRKLKWLSSIVAAKVCDLPLPADATAIAIGVVQLVP